MSFQFRTTRTSWRLHLEVFFERALGRAILFGLKLLVAADIVKTVTSTPSLTNAAVLGMIVLIRTVLSISMRSKSTVSHHGARR